MANLQNPRAPSDRRLRSLSFFFLLLLYALVAAALRPLLRFFHSWLAVACAPFVYGGILVALSVGIVAAAVAPAALVAWITVVVLMTVAGRPRRLVVEEGVRITADVAGVAFRAVAREGNTLAVACAAVSVFAALRWKSLVEEEAWW